MHGEGTERPLDLFFIGVLFFQRRIDYNQIHYAINMASDMIDSLRGNNNTKIVHLLDLLKKQLDRIEKKIEGLE